tara:strand:- start:4 stop:156 length:153 start_codon:yes stop_codon:yes gene_type:complete
MPGMRKVGMRGGGMKPTGMKKGGKVRRVAGKKIKVAKTVKKTGMKKRKKR